MSRQSGLSEKELLGLDGMLNGLTSLHAKIPPSSNPNFRFTIIVTFETLPGGKTRSAAGAALPLPKKPRPSGWNTGP